MPSLLIPSRLVSFSWTIVGTVVEKTTNTQRKFLRESLSQWFNLCGAKFPTPTVTGWVIPMTHEKPLDEIPGLCSKGGTVWSLVYSVWSRLSSTEVTADIPRPTSDCSPSTDTGQPTQLRRIRHRIAAPRRRPADRQQINLNTEG